MLQAWAFPSGSAIPEPLDVADALARARDARDLVWIDAEDPSGAELQRIADAFDLGEFLLEDLREGSADAGQRTKLVQHGEVFHVAINDCTMTRRRLHLREIDLVFGRRWVCSVRHPAESAAANREPFPIAGVHQRVDAQCAHEREIDEGFIVWAFVDLVTDRYLEITNGIDDRLDEAESRLLDDDGAVDDPESPRELFDTGRLLTQFRHQVIPLREVVGALLRREDPAIGDAALLHLRDVYDHLLGVAEIVESQRDVLAGLRDVHLTVVSNRMNRSMQQLAAWGAILIVATLITGVLGMNFRDQPNVSWATGFVAVVAVMAVVTVPMWLFFRRKRWL